MTFAVFFQPITMVNFEAYIIQCKGLKSKMGGFDEFFKILPIYGFWSKILILRLIFLVEIKRIKVNWCPKLDGLQ